MSMPDVSPYLIHHGDYPDEVGVCLTFPDAPPVYLTAEAWDQLSIEADDALSVDPALLHSSIAAQARLDTLRDK